MHARLSLACILGLTPSVALLQGCAAILGSKTDNVAAVSQPPGAEVYLDGVRAGVTPDTISVESKKSHTMTFRLPGYREESCTLTSSVDGGWVILDVLLGGLVGVIVDAATSEWNELTKKSCNLALTPDNAGNPAVVTNSPQRAPRPGAQQPVIQSFQSSAPNEIVSDGIKTERRFIVGDMLRANVATSVEQGPPGILRVGVGRSFHSHEMREFYFGKLASAYHTWGVDGHPLVIEVWEGGGKIGEYTGGTFLIGPGYTTPLDCPEGATTGLCSFLGESVQQETSHAATDPGRVVVPAEQPPAAAPQAESNSNAIDRSGFHFGLGLGGGAVDLTCEGCDFESLTGFSGYLSLGAWVSDKTVLGIESTGWTRDESGSTAQVYSLMAHITEYPSTSSGLFLRAGLGLVGYHEDTGLGDFSANAFGFSGRLGYELGRGGVKAVPYVGYLRTFGGAELKLDGDELDFDAAIGNFQFGLSIAAY